MTLTDMRWLNEPPEWSVDDDLLSVTTGERTDFWRETHYGFVRDNGHFFYTETEGDFSAEATFSAEYEHLYDQAGLMLRLNERYWIKAGVEYSDGERLLSTVVTRERSDWSVTSLDADTFRGDAAPYTSRWGIIGSGFAGGSIPLVAPR